MNSPLRPCAHLHRHRTSVLLQEPGSMKVGHENPVAVLEYFRQAGEPTNHLGTTTNSHDMKT